MSIEQENIGTINEVYTSELWKSMKINKSTSCKTNDLVQLPFHPDDCHIPRYS